MRLSAFKARGFKSFCDPVSFKVSGELTGIVGPNGCGKSNIVDAVRWVLGESRASSLRGSILADVMFNGSEKRPPADWCEVELRFTNHNTDGGAGLWSAYPEINVKRELSRDGRQSYTINGNVVRRRDVVDLFRGTGVAPRAYGVVEQGMVADIAEASPEELRSYLEEAAGVSHYKERRRDSERRLAASNENLSQLALVLDGMQKRVDSLRRQARTAARYRVLSDDINRLNALLILSRSGSVEQELAQSRSRLQQWEDKSKTLNEQLAKSKAQSSDKKQSRSALQKEADEAAAVLAEAQKKLIVAERDIQNIAQGKNTARARWQEARSELDSIIAQAQQMQQEEQQLQQQQAALQADITKSNTAAAAETEELSRLQVEYTARQNALDGVRDKLAACERQLESDTVRQKMLDERLQEIDQQLQSTAAALESLPAAQTISPQSAEQNHQLISLTEQLQQARLLLEQHTAATEAADADVRQLENNIAKRSAEIQTLNSMLQDNNWQEKGERLAHILQIEAGDWARALDAALGMYAAALAVDNIDTFINEQQQQLPAGLAVIETTPGDISADNNNSQLLPLIEHIQVPAQWRQLLSYWLADVYAADDDAAAAAARPALTSRQRIVTRSGAVYGAHSLFITGETRGGHDWEQRMRKLRAQEKTHQNALAAAVAEHNSCQQKQREQSDIIDNLTQQLQQAQHEQAQREIEQSRAIEQQRVAHTRREELTAQQQQYRQRQEESSSEQVALAQAQSTRAAERSTCEQEFRKSKEALDNISAALESYRKTVQEAVLARRDKERLTEEKTRRLQEIAGRKHHNSERQQLMQRRLQEFSGEIEKYDQTALQKTVDECRQQATTAEKAATDRRQKLHTLDGDITAIEEQCEALRSSIEGQQREIADERVKERELLLNATSLSDTLEELELSEEQISELKNEVTDGQDNWQEKMDELRGKRDRLGAINFMAESEMHESDEKLTDLQQQRADIETAIAELKTTIRRIDGETKQRLQSTFDSVNREFEILYKRIFDGGEACVEMLGDSILEAGFELKVRPPGKRLFPIHMLSGGEKAASAVAFIFAILRLNPPPFCILDEVDASLDDNRSRRFVELLNNIADSVQCLVVTHNKSTISSLSRLIGVTQEEAGTSKIVSVAVSEALRNVSE